MIIGIDIGTSNSSVCFINEKGDAVPVNISTGMSMYGSNFSMPSAVYVEDDGNVLVGQAALNSRLRKPQCFRAEFKRNLGESIPILLGSRSFLPEDLYTELFRHMLTCVQKLGQGQVEKTYVTHPASYGQERKNKILSAAKAAGLFDVTLVDEPTSAAMHYLHLGYLKDGQTLLVYDFGGGTFDVSLIQYKSSEFITLTEPLGLEHCGGIDIDRAIFADILSQISADTLKPLQANPTQRLRLESKLAELAVKAKHHLTASTIYQEYIDIGWDGFEYTLTQDKLNGMIASLVQKTIDCCRGILAEANLSVDKLDGILLNGGTSRIPLVMQMIDRFAGKIPVLCSVDLELAVAQGVVCSKNIGSPKSDIIEQDNKKIAELKQATLTKHKQEQLMLIAVLKQIMLIKKKQEQLMQIAKPTLEVRGNTAGNTANGGSVAKDGKYIYYVCYKENGALYKMRADGSNRTKLVGKDVRHINVIDGWIYYENDGPSNVSGVYKLRSDGIGTASRLTFQYMTNADLNVIDNWIYYSTHTHGIYRIQTDGQNNEKISSDRHNGNMTVVNGWVYYTTLDKNGMIIKMRTDGSEMTSLSLPPNLGDIKQLIVIDDWIYFNASNSIQKMPINGNFWINLSGYAFDNYTSINVTTDGWIYYCAQKELHKMRTDGSDKKKIANLGVNSHLVVVDDYIYYYGRASFIKGGDLYRVKKDGTNAGIILA